MITLLLTCLIVAVITATVIILAACIVSGRNRHLLIILFVLWLPFVTTLPQIGDAVACDVWECGGWE